MSLLSENLLHFWLCYSVERQILICFSSGHLQMHNANCITAGFCWAFVLVVFVYLYDICDFSLSSSFQFTRSQRTKWNRETFTIQHSQNLHIHNEMASITFYDSRLHRIRTANKIIMSLCTVSVCWTLLPLADCNLPSQLAHSIFLLKFWRVKFSWIQNVALYRRPP